MFNTRRFFFFSRNKKYHVYTLYLFLFSRDILNTDMQHISTNQKSNLEALCTLSDTPKAVNPSSLTKLITEAPDPETALRTLLESMPSPSHALKVKWHKIVKDIWVIHHPHVSELLDLPFAANDISHTNALNEALEFLNIIQNKPLNMIQENKEWLVSPSDVYYLATQLPSLHNQPAIQSESEWQYLPLHRLRNSLQSLRLVRRYKNQLVIVKSRYARFLELPTVQQYYLLWHADTYHIDWSDYAGVWGDFMRIVQEYLPLLWGVSQDKEPDLSIDIRQWNKEVLESFQSPWQQEGLLDQQPPQTALLSLVRFQSLPTALTQVVLKDLFVRFGIIYGEGTLFAYTKPGLQLLHAEHNQDLPFNLDLLL